MLRWSQAIALAAITVGCSKPPPQPSLPSGPEGTTEWRKRRADLKKLRHTFDAGRPFSLNVTLDLYVERLGMRTRGRGAIAVHPPHGVRMILLGPAGTTAMDLWICRDQFRFSVPALDLTRRGDAGTPVEELRGLPVEFLRWWFLEPLGGTLLAAFDRGQENAFILKDNNTVVQLLAGPGSPTPLTIRRLSAADEETLETTAELCGHVHYNQHSTSVDLNVQCEKVNEGAPSPRAFVDPDDPENRCITDVENSGENEP